MFMITLYKPSYEENIQCEHDANNNSQLESY